MILPPESPLPTWSLPSPFESWRHPFGNERASKLWPAAPLNLKRIVSSGRPPPPYLRLISLPRIVPTVRWTLRISRAVPQTQHRPSPERAERA